MNRSRAWFEWAARETGYRADTLEKVVRLGELAGEVARHPLLGSVLVLKGGTALNLCFGPPRRLSVDLDFNFVGPEDRDEMLERRPVVERSLESLAGGRGYQIQWSRAEHAGRKAYLRYISSAGVNDRVEVDLNFLHRVAVDPPLLAELWQPADAEWPSLSLVGIGELIAGKLGALLDRGAPRDLFDATHLPTVAGAEWGLPAFVLCSWPLLAHSTTRCTPTNLTDGGGSTTARFGSNFTPRLPIWHSRTRTSSRRPPGPCSNPCSR